MLYTARSGELEFSADTFGAELHSVKFQGREYLWQCGDAWKRYAPILFPFVCSPEGRTYKAGGKTYKMKANHGFARDCEFELSSQSGSSVEFVLRENEETLAQYPYRFTLTVRYTAEGNSVKVENIVKNTNENTMYFYLGGHPAFNCPLEEGECFDDYYIQYEKNEKISRIIDGEKSVLIDGSDILPVTRSLFDYDAIILDKPNSKAVSLRSEKSEHSVTVRFPLSDCIAVWSPTADDRAEFVCLEPWTSVPVYADDEFEDIERKPHAIALDAGKEYYYSYSIELS